MSDAPVILSNIPGKQLEVELTILGLSPLKTASETCIYICIYIDM